LRQRATKFMGVSKDTARSEADILSTPLPGERIRQFYERSKQYWAGTAYESSGSRGKALRREGFRESAVITIATHRHRTDYEQNLHLQSTRSTSPSSRKSRGSSAKRSWMRRSQRRASGLAVWAPARADIGDDTVLYCQRLFQRWLYICTQGTVRVHTETVFMAIAPLPPLL
jgi:hypothetical protein